MRLRHNEKTDLFTFGEQFSFVTKKGSVEYPAEKVIDSYTSRNEAIVAFIKKVNEVSSTLVEQLKFSDYSFFLVETVYCTLMISL